MPRMPFAGGSGLALAIALTWPHHVDAQGGETLARCSRDIPAAQRVDVCRAEAAFEPRSVRARLEYGWALVESTSSLNR